MKNPLISLSWRVVVICFCLVSSRSLLATPYATDLRNLNGVVSFRLNESADQVQILDQTSGQTHDLGPLDKGLHNITLNVTGDFEVQVSKVSPPGFLSSTAPNKGAVLQISVDSTPVRFNNPRGIAVNTNPKSPYFGRVYVANAAAGTTTTGGRLLGDGIYLLNSDLTDAVGQGDNARTGGLDFSSGQAVSPYRLTVGEDDNLYIADWSDSTGSLYLTDPDVAEGSGKNVLGGPTGAPFPVTSERVHGSIAAAVVEGSLAAGNLVAYVIDEDLQEDPDSGGANQRNSLWQHDIGGTLPGPFVLPTRLSTHGITFVSQTMDLARGPNKTFYISNYRSAGSQAGLYVRENDGTGDWDSLTKSRELPEAPTADVLRATGGVAVSPNGDYGAVVNIENNQVTVFPLVDGYPDLERRLVFAGFGTAAQGRDLAFDAAGNLYVISSGFQLLRVFSPGGFTIARTGSDGTFNVESVKIDQSVTVEATTPTAKEGGENAVLTFQRTGNTIEPLTVKYTFSGTATAEDYSGLDGTASFAAGSTTATLTLTAVDDELAERVETLIVNLQNGTNYVAAAPVSATVTLLDNESPTLVVSATDTNVYERLAGDVATFRLERLGETTSSVNVVIGWEGSATADTDFTANTTNPLTLDAGVIEANLGVTGIDDAEVEGPERIVLRLLAGSGYTVGEPASAEVTLVDDDLGPETILFADSFDPPGVGENWIVRFGANNGLDDYTAAFGYDYSGLAVPPAPGQSATTGLYIDVNKLDNTAGGAAGINLYPLSENFSGNYALRFSLFVNIGATFTTEHVLVGLNHSGELTNRVSQNVLDHPSTAGGDGVWFAFLGDGSENRAYALYTVPSPTSLPSLTQLRTAASMRQILNSPPYTPRAGSPGNSSTSETKSWVDVEVNQINDVISLLLNNTLVMQYTNTTPFKSGKIMIGHSDQFDSIAPLENFLIFDNLRVVELPKSEPPATISIQSIAVNDGQADIRFTSAKGAAGDFTIQSAASLPGEFVGEPNAVVENVSAGEFRARVPVSGTQRFFQVVR